MGKVYIFLVNITIKDEVRKILRQNIEKGLCLDFISINKMIRSDIFSEFNEKLFKGALLNDVVNSIIFDYFIVIDVLSAVNFYKDLKSKQNFEIIQIISEKEILYKDRLTYKLLNTSDLLSRYRIKNEIRKLQNIDGVTLIYGNLRVIKQENLAQYLNQEFSFN